MIDYTEAPRDRSNWQGPVALLFRGWESDFVAGFSLVFDFLPDGSRKRMSSVAALTPFVEIKDFRCHDRPHFIFFGEPLAPGGEPPFQRLLIDGGSTCLRWCAGLGKLTRDIAAFAAVGCVIHNSHAAVLLDRPGVNRLDHIVDDRLRTDQHVHRIVTVLDHVLIKLVRNL